MLRGYLVGGERHSSPSLPEGEGIGSRRESSPLCVVDVRMTVLSSALFCVKLHLLGALWRTSLGWNLVRLA